MGWYPILQRPICFGIPTGKIQKTDILPPSSVSFYHNETTLDEVLSLEASKSHSCTLG